MAKQALYPLSNFWQHLLYYNIIGVARNLKEGKNIGNFCHIIDCSSCEVFRNIVWVRTNVIRWGPKVSRVGL